MFYRCTLQNYTINVLDVNEHSPVFDKSEYQVTVNENFTIGQKILSVNAKDYDSLNEPVYSINEVRLFVLCLILSMCFILY